MKTLTNGILAILFLAACSDDSGEVTPGSSGAELQSKFWATYEGDYYELYRFQSDNALIYHELRYNATQGTVTPLSNLQGFYEIRSKDRIQIGQAIWTFEVDGDTVIFYNEVDDWGLGAMDPDLYNQLIELYDNG